MKLGEKNQVIYQGIILNKKEVDTHLEDFIKYIDKNIPLKKISKNNAKCVGLQIISSKQAEKIKFDYPKNFDAENEEHTIHFAYDENHHKEFIGALEFFWSGKH